MANSSLRTQCAAAAAADVLSPIIFHRHLRQARKKLKKQEHVLREVVVPMIQLKITTSKINNEVIVFDGVTTIPLLYAHLMGFNGIPLVSENFALKTRQGVT